ERREVALADGRSTIAGLIRREGLGLKPSERESLLAVVAEELGFPSVDGMLSSVGERGIGGPVVINRLARLVRGPDVPDDEPDLLAPPRTPKSLRRPGTGVIVEGLDDVLVRIARCCAPVPGDDIVGFVTVGRGVSIHRSDCTNVSSLGDQPDRMIDVNWAPERIGTFAIWVQVESLDRSGLLRDVSAAITDVGGNIVASSSASGRDRVAILRYAVELSDPSQVGFLISHLQGVDGVYEAFRIQGAPAEL
ncbi:MAG: GTP pyrophosphokinase, partial [Acidimicrobiia bacterium]|nr:GTP pyrophosphokinase [Acidimicrobiia bacterium]